MKHRTSSNDTCATHKRAHGPGGWSAAARVLIIMIASLLLLSLRASITRAEDPPVEPAIYLPVVANPTNTSPPPPGDDWSADEKAKIKNIVDNAAKLKPLADERHDIDTKNLEPPGDDYRYTYEKHDVVDNIEDVLYLGLNDDIVWPGSLVRGDTAHDFVYNPILLPRAPLMLSVSLESACTGPSITHEVVDPKLSTVRQGISDLLKKAVVDCTTVPAQADFKYEEIYNESHMNLFAEANIKYGGSLDTKFDWDSEAYKHKIMARYRQVYYSIDIDTPSSPAVLFDPSRTSVGEIGTAMPAGSMPMYIAGVKYGMMALMFIETNFKAEDMNLALNAAYGGGDLEADLGFGYSTREVMEQSKVQIVVYGGSTKGLKDLEAGFPGFKNVMEASRDFTPDSPGVPLVYKFRHLKDNTLGLITLTSQYALVKPLQIRQRVRITVLQLTQSGCHDGAGGCELDRMGVWVKGWNRRDTSDPGILVTPADHPTHGAEVFYRETSGEWPVNGYLPVNESLDLTFSTDQPYDFNLARMYFYAYAREWDTPTNPPEDSDGYYEVFGNQFFAGDHKIHVGGGDFEGDYETLIEKIPSSPYPPPSPFTGTPVSFESFNFPNHYLYDENFSIKLKENDGTPAFAKYSTFKKRPGLAGRDDNTLVSIESNNFPGYYLVHLVGLPDLPWVVLLGRDNGSTGFAKAATFQMVSGLADASLISFASVEFPGRYLRHSNYWLVLQQYDGTTQFAADATFKEVPGLAD